MRSGALQLSRKQVADAYGLAEQFEEDPRSIWGYVQGLSLDPRRAGCRGSDPAAS
jgi:hypothetical protein